MRAWMQTLTKRQFFFERPEDYRYDIVEIATVLSRLPRFNGHTAYSVAEHSIFVARLVAEHTLDHRVIRAALLHDAAEAFFGDMVSPLRRLPGMERYNALIKNCERCIATQFDLAEPAPPTAPWDWVRPPLAWDSLIKQADYVALATERRDVIGTSALDVDWPELPDPSSTVINMPPRDAEQVFVEFCSAWRAFGGVWPYQGSL